MKSRRRLHGLSLAFLLLTQMHQANAAEFHVCINGNNSNPGTLELPLRTIQRAAELARPGDIITVHDGTYRERVIPPRGGNSESQRIVYRAQQGDQPVIKGSERITNWVHQAGGVWRVELDASFFGGFNPYTLSVDCGRWMDYGKWHHRGDVYLDGEAFIERKSEAEVAANLKSWFTSTNGLTTRIVANFGKANPNQALAEINVRDMCFAPESLGVNYITLSGLVFRHAATYWAGPDCADQTGAICTKTGHHWIVENCVVSDSRCCGIAIGRWTGGQESADSGHHIIRNNRIQRCGETAIVGARYNYGTVIEGNLVEEINCRNEFGGGETAGIKLHFAVDVVIRNNLIRKVRGDSGNFGLWMDWSWQNARVTGNVFMDTQGPALYIECSWGPNLIDNNVFIGGGVSQTASQSALFVHNLFWNAPIQRGEDMSRSPQYWIPHTVTKAGSGPVKTSRDGWYNNIFIGKGLNCVGGSGFKAGYNLYLEGARPSPIESNSVVSANKTKFASQSDQSGVSVKFTMNNAPWKLRAPLMGTNQYGEIAECVQRSENADGTPLFVDTDFFGRLRNTNGPLAGPFENLKIGRNHLELFNATKQAAQE